ncbi:aldo/keto reductase [Macrococcoides caseolyticum]|uniref:aldo/keto reductase n=1 Tax=Macrococcoides caseolyticum TaxID=69966 RepID=UPI000A28F132|nr:aldo/keto reductase [Macrococcus caseolyticus]ARQ03813.1 putative oxidoreductase [Macrococcus caseolyticus]PKE12902.1 aldo/keto reductase [Macrococcus caseolyticus]PKE48142.1 aldo/keto reductase [Macrococcus caseolyticus]PKF15059.1 aldo/keto reductase [Macrococcus caseolyticus]PNZ73189.1 aldo/keto reductase [Macrococcus caseolyticus]
MMNHIQLNNGVTMPQIGLGVYKISDETMSEVVNAALDAGYRAFDTAHFYFNEASLGKALKESNIPREELFITTKLWNDHQGYESTKKAFNDSLQKLDMDYVDLYLIHWPCPEDGLFVESYKAMEELYHEGKIKALGVANFKEHHLDKLLQETTVVPAVNQIEYHPIFNQDNLQQYCKDKGIAVTAWSPLMRGGELFEDGTLKRIAEKYNKTVAQVIIRWHIDSGRIVIPKSSNIERIKENIDVCHFELMEQDIEAINNLNRNERQFKDPDKIKIGDMK